MKQTWTFRLYHHLFIRKIAIAKWQFNAAMIVAFSVGIVFSFTVLLNSVVLPSLFAASVWTQTDWSGGEGTSTSNQFSSSSGILYNVGGSTTLQKNEYFTHGGVNSVEDTAAWTGADPSTYSGLTLHLKADAGVMSAADCLTSQTSNGGAVGCWLDQSGANHHVKQSSGALQPVFATNGPNGRPYIQFLGDFLNGSEPFVIQQNYVVFKSPNAVFNNYGGPLGVINYSDGRPYIFENNQAYFHSNPQPVAVWKNSIVVPPAGQFVLSPLTSWMALTVNTAYATNSRTYQIGGSENGYIAQLHIAELIGYNRTLSSIEQSALENHLNLKYNTSYSVTVDTTTKRAGTGSAKIIAPASRSIEFVQTANLGTTDSRKLLAYAYTTGGAVTSADAQLYVRSGAVATTYTSVGNGWYELSAVVAGSASNDIYGVQIKAGKTVYLDELSLFSYVSSGTLISNVYDTNQASAWGSLAFTADVPTGTSLQVRVKTSNSATPMNFSGCNPLVSGTDLSPAENPQSNCVSEGHRYIQYQVTYGTSDPTKTPSLSDISIGYQLADSVKPTVNASALRMFVAPAGREIPVDQWNNTQTPYFTWSSGSDDLGGIGLLGYCAYLGLTAGSNPESTKGILGTSPVEIPPGSTCSFIVSGESLNLSSDQLLESSLVSGNDYYFALKAIDIAGNVFAGSATEFHFLHDSVAPTNVSYISTPVMNFSNVVDMNFSWPTDAGVSSSDDHSHVLGWQYQINGTSGAWKGTNTSTRLGFDYIPNTENHLILSQARDENTIVQGSNIVYFRTVDNAGNTSAPASYRTGSLKFGGAAPTFEAGCEDTLGITVTPSTATDNNFALSWPMASSAGDTVVSNYYYMVNTTPPSAYATLTDNPGTYFSNDINRTVTTQALPNVNKGVNTVYVVATDNAQTPNYSPSNCLKGTFTLDSTDPDNPGNLIASDSSIKSQSQWNVTLTWTAPAYQGAGNLTYLISRSSDNLNFSQVGSTTGLSYVDNAPASQTYYYKVHSRDGAQAQSSGTNAVVIKPTGKFTSPAALESGPTVATITTKKATISWSTDRASDSKVAFGTKSGQYGDEEPSNASQLTSHTIKLTNLSPGTTYFYRSKWTDGDGNTGISDEKLFTTEPSPTVTDPSAQNVSLSSATLQYTVTGASSVKIYYGETINFGATKTVATGTSENTYTTLLENLSDGTKYFYKINTIDSEGSEYEGNTLSFETLPRPKIANVRIQQVANTAQSTILVTWQTNTEVSSIVTYYPEGNTDAVRDEVNVALTSGSHRMILRGLIPQKNYVLTIKGRDKIGNEAQSDVQRVTTATDTRPPQISEIKVEGTTDPNSPGDNETQPAQLIVSWNTDEPATSQVEFGEGTGKNYAQKTQQDSSLTYNHLVVISGLTASKVYHLRALSKDTAGNTGQSIDTVSITPKATDNALDLVINNLQQVFGFFGTVNER